MAVVDAAISRPGELQDALSGGTREAPRRGPPAVAMNDAVDAPRPESTEQAPRRPLAASQQGAHLGDRQRSLPPATKDVDSLLVLRVHDQSLPHSVRLTKSLSSCRCHIH